MKTLNFICPRCVSYGNKTDIVCHYQDDALIIPWECPKCKFLGEWHREVTKSGLFVRIIQAVKRAWGYTK